MKIKKFRIGIITLVCLMSMFLPTFAEQSSMVLNDEIYVGDYMNNVPVVINKDETRGDIFSLSQRLVMDGVTKGDILGYAGELSVGGLVDGNIRAVGNTAYLSGKVNRTLMFAGNSFVQTQDATIGGNAYVAGVKISMAGTTQGKVMLYGDHITLSGRFMSDVDLNKESNFGGGNQTPSPVTTLIISPDTYIAGTLTVRAETAPVIPATAHIGKLDFIQVSAAVADKPRIQFRPILRDVLTTLVFFLFALLLYRIFPRFFARQSDFLRYHMLSTAGIGIAALGTIVAAIILLFILTILTLFLFNFAVVGFSLTVFYAFIVITGYLTVLPVSLWLGRVMLGEAKSIPAALAAGLTVITLLRIVMDMAVFLPVAGDIIGVIYFIVQLVIWLLGMGAILHTVSDFVKSANRGAEIQEEPFDLTI